MKHYDVIVIGTGAGGGTLVSSLARKGLEVLVLERGGWVNREPQNLDPKEVFQLGRYVSPDTWVDGITGKTFQPGSHYNVGGATKFYGAALFRLRPDDFGIVRHIDSESPAWPIGYDELRPYYALAEKMYQVHGNAGEDPTEGPRAPYMYPGGVALIAHPATVGQADGGGLPPVPRTVCGHAGRGEAGAVGVHEVQLLRRPPVHSRGEGGRRDRGHPPRNGPAERHAGHRRRGGRDRGEERPRGRRVGSPGRPPRLVQRRRDRAGCGRGEHSEDPTCLGHREQLGPGGAKLHVPPEPRGDGCRARAQRRGVPEDARCARLLPAV